MPSFLLRINMDWLKLYIIYILLELTRISCMLVYLNSTNVEDILRKLPELENTTAYLTENVQLKSYVHINMRSAHFMLCGESHTITCAARNAGIRVTGHDGYNTFMLDSVVVNHCGPNISSALSVENVDAIVKNCTFRDNIAAGFNAKDSNVTVMNSVFVNNDAHFVAGKFNDSFLFGVTNIGGGIGILFNDSFNLHVLIENSKFLNNSAFVSKDEFVNTHPTSEKRLVSNYFTLGGGISILHLFNTSGNIVNIKNTALTGNTATYAGGLFVTFAHNASMNKVHIKNASINGNSVPQTGGGFVCSSWDYAHNNHFEIYDSIVEKNSAMTGGGGKLILNNRHPERREIDAGVTKLKIVRTNITENQAKSASALRLLMKLPPGIFPRILPVFESIRIVNNFPKKGSKEHIGAVISSSFSFIVTGKSVFQKNKNGSAIYLSNAQLHIDGQVSFQGNHGKYGGGIHVTDLSKIIIYENSTLTFWENTADIAGGALYVQSPNYVETMYPFNPSCFLQFHKPRTRPSQWKARIEFIKNSATQKGAAIYISTLLHCQWHEDSILGFHSYKKALKWSKKLFTYRRNYLSHKTPSCSGGAENCALQDVDIATDTYTIEVYSSSPVQVAPGEPYPLNVTVMDQLDNPVYSSPLLKHVQSDRMTTFSKQHVFLSKAASIIKLSLKMPNATIYEYLASEPHPHELQISDTSSQFEINAYISIRTLKCHPGFTFKEHTCVCDTTIQGVIGCKEGRYVLLKEGYWAGIIDGKLVTYICPRGYCSCKKNVTETLNVGCIFDYLDSDTICANGRWNTLCGSCKQGLSIGSKSHECLDCSDSSILILLPILLILIFSLIVMWYNFGIPANLRGILFYFQVLPYAFTPNDHVGDYVHTVIGAFGLGDFPSSTCLVPGLDNTDKAALSYVFPGTIATCLFIVYTFRHKISWPERKHPFKCFFTLFTLISMYLMENSLLIFHCVNIEGESLFYIDGSVECYVGRHLLLLLFAGFLLVALTVVILFIPYIVSGKAKCFILPIREEIRNGYRAREAFWEDKRWWWSFDLSRRFIFMSVFVYVEDPKLKQTMMVLVCLCFLIIHGVNQPYDDEAADDGLNPNVIESCYLFALTALINIQTIELQLLRHVLSVCILIPTTGGVLYILLRRCMLNFCRMREGTASRSDSFPRRPSQYDMGITNNVAIKDNN